MNNIVQLESDIYVCGQIGPEDIEHISSLGIRTIVDNRPDEELDEQPTSATIERAAAGHGLSFLYRPVWGFDLTDPDIQQSVWQSLSDMPRPVLLYCRSGRRSTLLWALEAIERLGLEAVQARTSRAGIDSEELQMIVNENSDQLAA